MGRLLVAAAGGGGTVFKVNTDGTGFMTLHFFSAVPHDVAYGANVDGASPAGGLILSGNTLYGEAAGGGSSGYGTVFSLSFAPQLTINACGNNVVLSWPSSVAGFDFDGYILQSTTNLDPPAVWSTVNPAPVVANGQNTVTTPIAGTQQFFRLKSP